jgi:phage tail sheath protein FI
MPEIFIPGVYVEEPGAVPPIAALATDIAGFVGLAEGLPGAAAPEDAIRSAVEFGKHWSTAATLAGDAPNLLWLAVQAYFANGGRQLHVVPVTLTEAAAGGHATAVARLADTDAAIIAAPDVQALPARLVPAGAADVTMRALVALAEAPGSNRFAIIDAPSGSGIAGVRGWRAGFDSRAAALYWPWLQTADGTQLPPSGPVAGAMAQADLARGVWKAPANLALVGVTAVAAISKADQEVLNPEGINAIRAFTGKGLLVWGARTLSSDPDWKYIPVRRLAVMLEASIARGLSWLVFEPNGPILWARVRSAVEGLLLDLWRQGALLGDKPERAWFVRCDAATMTADDLVNGRLVAEIGHAPLRPGEFLIFRFSAATAT